MARWSYFTPRVLCLIFRVSHECWPSSATTRGQGTGDGSGQGTGDRSDKEEGERRREWNWDHGCRKFEFEGRRGRGGGKQIGRDPESRKFSTKQSATGPAESYKAALNTCKQIGEKPSRGGS